MGGKGILATAIGLAIGYCKGHDILSEFWQRLTNEEVNMLATEWNWEDALAVREEEGLEEGIERVAENALREGYSIEAVQKISGLSIKRLKELLQDVTRKAVV
jgi:AraC-like DNA-binding protein